MDAAKPNVAMCVQKVCAHRGRSVGVIGHFVFCTCVDPLAECIRPLSLDARQTQRLKNGAPIICKIEGRSMVVPGEAKPQGKSEKRKSKAPRKPRLQPGEAHPHVEHMMPEYVERGPKTEPKTVVK